MGKNTEPHPLCLKLRQLRRAAGLSLTDMGRYGVSPILVGSYERGDRIPPLSKIDSLFRLFGYRLAAVPIDSNAVRPPEDIVETLHAIANQLDATGPRAAA